MLPLPLINPAPVPELAAEAGVQVLDEASCAAGVVGNAQHLADVLPYLHGTVKRRGVDHTAGGLVHIA